MRHRRLWLAAVLAAGSLALPTVAAGARPSRCGDPPTLVLAAMPLELNPLLEVAEGVEAVRIEDRTFYEAALAGQRVVLAMTGIGMANAAETTELALDHFGCGFRAAVFSGVAGSRHRIGDVAVPARWTADGGATWTGADRRMLRIAAGLVGRVPLARDVPVGDAACLCPGVDAPLPVRLAHEPAVVVGGDGTTYDQFGGTAVPCLPGGGDVAGCEPCLGPHGAVQDALDFAANAPELADPDFVEAFLRPPQPTTSVYDAQDLETAAFAEAAAASGVPFLAVRAASDGQGDPLGLPGFPSQFFAYRQLAGDNAAAVTLAFLEAWADAGRPTSP
jgi:nucleoside phosphorylase